MDYYINPPNMTKKQWLRINGVEISENEANILNVPGGIGALVPVCLVDNGDFTAAGIAYNNAELTKFLRPCGWPKMWYLVPRNKLKPYCGAL